MMNDNFCLMVSDHLTTQESKEERAHVRSWVGRVLVLAALLVTTVYATGAYATTFSLKADNGDQITLMESPCTHSPWFKDWQAARFIYRGKTYEACWRLVGGDTVLVFDSGGDISPVPMGAFRKDEGV